MCAVLYIFGKLLQQKKCYRFIALSFIAAGGNTMMSITELKFLSSSPIYAVHFSGANMCIKSHLKYVVKTKR